MTSPILQPKPTAEQEPKLPDQIADAWVAVLIDTNQRLKQRKKCKKPALALFRSPLGVR